MKVDIFVRPSFYSTFYVNSHIDKASSLRANKLSFLFLPSAIVSFGGSKPSFAGVKPLFAGTKQWLQRTKLLKKQALSIYFNAQSGVYSNWPHE